MWVNRREHRSVLKRRLGLVQPCRCLAGRRYINKAEPSKTKAAELGSGTTAIASNESSPIGNVSRDAFTGVPEVVYSPTWLGPDTNICPLPSRASPRAEFNPEISEAFTVAPEVVY